MSNATSYDRERKRRLRQDNQKAIAKLKNRPCADCGGFFHHVCMDFDHRPGVTKVLGVSELVAKSKTWTVVAAEIAKCDLVCANCHRIRTYDRIGAANSNVDKDQRQLMLLALLDGVQQ